MLDKLASVEDEQFIKMVEAMLDVYLAVEDVTPGEASEDEDLAPHFNPLDYHTPEEIAQFEAKDDFLGYGVKGKPLFGRAEAEKADKEIEAILSGEVKGISLEELKIKTARWQAPTK